MFAVCTIIVFMYSIETSGGCIEYTLERRKMKNIRIRITGASKVVVSAPSHTPEHRIHQFVHENEEFILRKLKNNSEKRNKYYPVKYLNSDTFWYLGQESRLCVIWAEQTSAVYRDGVLTLFMPEGSDYRYRKALFILWMERKAANVFRTSKKEIFPKFSNLIKKDVRISVKNMLTRWGSINTKRHSISLTVHLLRCDPELIDYVIIHELCHFAYGNHSKAFYAELDKHCNNRKQLDKRLAEYGLIDF